MSMIPILRTLVPRLRARFRLKETHTDACNDSCACNECAEHTDSEVHNVKSDSRNGA